MTDAVSQEVQHETVDGTSSHASYFVVAKNGNVALGLSVQAIHRHYGNTKGLGYDPFFLDVRVRSCPAPGAPGYPTDDEICKSFGTLPFESLPYSGTPRASFPCSIMTNQKDRSDVPDALKQQSIGAKIVDFLGEHFATALMVLTAGEIESLILKQVFERTDVGSASLGTPLEQLARIGVKTDNGFVGIVQGLREGRLTERQEARKDYDEAMQAIKDRYLNRANEILAEYHASHPVATKVADEPTDFPFGPTSVILATNEDDEDVETDGFDA